MKAFLTVLSLLVFVPHSAGWVTHWNPVDTSPFALSPEAEIPVHHEEPSVYMIPRWHDLFHDEIPGGLIEEVFGIMFDHPRHIFIICTESRERLRWEWLDINVYLNIIIISDQNLWPSVKTRICGPTPY